MRRNTPESGPDRMDLMLPIPRLASVDWLLVCAARRLGLD